MVSTYSTRLRLELIGTGDQSGTWGVTANKNLGTLLEEAIAGLASVTHDDTADYTLTANNGLTDEARRMIVEVGGTLTAQRNVVCPTASKLYVVSNATSGGFDIVFKTSAGTGITVSNGSKRLLYCDGTNVVDALTELPAGVVTSTQLASNSVTTAKITAANVTATELATDSVTTAKIVDANVTTAKVADANVTAAKLATDSVTTAKIADANVTTAKIADANVTTTKIADANVTTAKLAATVGVTPIGGIIGFGGSSAPTGWLLCDGSAVSRTTYSALFAEIGTAYGVGDGSTTFNLPDYRGRSLLGAGQGDTAEGGGTGTSRSLGDEGGAETHTLIIAEIPSHDHDYLNKSAGSAFGGDASGGGDLTQTTTATGGGGAHNNMHPFTVANVLIFAGV